MNLRTYTLKTYNFCPSKTTGKSIVTEQTFCLLRLFFSDHLSNKKLFIFNYLCYTGVCLVILVFVGIDCKEYKNSDWDI